MKPKPYKYAEFVEHPRYGRGPRITGLNPHPGDPGVHLHWNATTYQEIVSQYEAVIGKWPFGDVGASAERTKRSALCRKRNHALGKTRATYERLQKLRNPADSDTVRLTEALLTLVENGIFSTRQTEHARALIKTLPDDARTVLLNRIRQIEETIQTADKAFQLTRNPRRTPRS
jgi:hypothetical protein